MKIIHHGERILKTDKKTSEKREFEKLSEVIIGAAIKVHKELGPGYLESIYEEALKVELSETNLNFRSFVFSWF